MENSFFNSHITQGNFWVPYNNSSVQPQHYNGNVQYLRSHFAVNSVTEIHYTNQVHREATLPHISPLIQMSPRVARSVDNFSKNEHALEHGDMQQVNYRQRSTIPSYGVPTKKEISPIVANDFHNFGKIENPSAEQGNHWQRSTIPSYGVCIKKEISPIVANDFHNFGKIENSSAEAQGNHWQRSTIPSYGVPSKTASSTSSDCSTNISFDDMLSMSGDLDEWHDVVQQYKLAGQKAINDPAEDAQLVPTICDTVINVDAFNDFHLSDEERAELFAIVDGTYPIDKNPCSESARDDIPQVVLNYEQSIMNSAPNKKKRKRENFENLSATPKRDLIPNLNQPCIVNSDKSVEKRCQTPNTGNSKRQTTTKNEKTFTCCICGKQFCRFGFFKRHIERQHHQNLYNGAAKLG
uniref:C2H2-type domain-containing protein n=1 Tax=Glossina austeni TaxID=7395 RepID=A0A1A9VWU8_GLOAU